MGASRSATAAVKVNLYLDVLAQRADGFHDLETLFLALPWGDEITVALADDPDAARPGIDLAVTGSVVVPAGEDNLAWRAAAAFLDAAGEPDQGVPARVHIRLDKRVPVGAGLGGGSADAATVLQLLSGLMPGRVEPARLAGIAAGLGADVPFLLQGGAAIGRGRGERLEAVTSGGPLDVVLILPPTGCDTAAVFGGFRRFRSAPSEGLRTAVAALRSGEPDRVRDAHYNALAFTVLKMHPPLRRFTADVERRLDRAPAMTGSGSALFDLPDAGETDAVLARLEGLPGSRVVVRG